MSNIKSDQELIDLYDAMDDERKKVCVILPIIYMLKPTRYLKQFHHQMIVSDLKVKQ